LTTLTPSPGELFVFQNQRHTRGYEIDAAGHIRPKTEDQEPGPPLTTSSSVAREFARVGPEEADVRAFTDRHGLLLPWAAQTLTNQRYSVDFFRANQNLVREVLTEIDRAGRAPTAREKKEAFEELADEFEQYHSRRFTYHLKFQASKGADRAIRIAPDSLMSAIGLMLAYEISGQIEWATCVQCGTVFPKGALVRGLRSRRAATCSIKCTRRIQEAKKAEEAKKKRAEAASVLKPRPCANCGDMFTPKRASTEHCGKPACSQALYRLRKTDTSAEKSKSTRGAIHRPRNPNQRGEHRNEQA
jgi:hypothetical protein